MSLKSLTSSMTEFLNITFIVFVGTMAGVILRPAIAFYARDLGATGVEIGALAAGLMLSRAITAPLVGYLSDVSRRRVLFLLIGFSISSLTALLYGMIREVHAIIALRVVDGFCSGATWPILQTIVSERVSRGVRGRAMALYFAAGSAAKALGYGVFGALNRLGFEILLLVGSALYLSASVASLGVREGILYKSEKHLKKASTAGKSFLPVYLIAFVMGCQMSVLHEIYVIYLNEEFMISRELIGMIVMISSGTAILLSVMLSSLSDKIGRMAVIKLSALMSMICSFTILIRSSILFPVIAGCLGYCATFTFMPVSRAFVVDAGGDKRALGIGFMNMSSNIGSVIFPLFAGFIYEKFQGKVLEVMGVAVSCSISSFIVVGVIAAVALVYISFSKKY